MTSDRAERALHEGLFGVLALDGDDGCPYAVPMSYVYEKGVLYFHSAPKGHKIDAISRNDKASFCVVVRNDVIPDELTTAYESVIAFGHIRQLEGAEKRHALNILGEKYNPGAQEIIAQEIEKEGKRCVVFALRIDHLTGKRGLRA